MTRRLRRSRAGALAVEGAIVYSVVCVLFFGLIVGGIGVFRYQQVALLAREGARFAAVHGSDWQSDNNQSACTASQILEQGVLPRAASMAPSAVSINVQFVNRAAGTVSDWDKAAHPPTSLDNVNNTVTNRVRITVTYEWVPGALMVGPLYLTSTSELSMSY